MMALLVLYQVGFPKTHNLGELLDLVSTVEPVLAGDLRGVTALNPYGVEYRYPGDFPELTEEDSRSAFGLAEKVREVVMPTLAPIPGVTGNEEWWWSPDCPWDDVGSLS
ncbi:MAG: HEPN domain-containing protein [Acidobacteria bacterium]|nr:HEPN domain-containing protein [Acidobacteriota bacterium]